VKRYIFTYFDFPDLNEDLRLMVGSLIWEYLHPLLTSENQHYLLD